VAGLRRRGHRLRGSGAVPDAGLQAPHHSGSAEADEERPASWAGDAKVSGIATEITDPQVLSAFAARQEQIPPGPFALFSVEPTEVTLITIAPSGDKLAIETWRPGRGITRHER
jgi:hypothetical protein